MSIVSRAADIYFTFRFLRQLVTPWNQTEAFKLGLIDQDGKLLRSPQTPEEKDAYNFFFRLVYNIKRLLNKIPLGKTRLASYAAALYLIRENTAISEESIKNILNIDSGDINESKLWMTRNEELLPGKYKLTNDILSPISGNVVGITGTIVEAIDGTPVDSILGINIYKVWHESSKQHIFVSLEDIDR